MLPRVSAALACAQAAQGAGMRAPGFTWGEVRYPSSEQALERDDLVLEGAIDQGLDVLALSATDNYGRVYADTVELRPPLPPTDLVVNPRLGPDRLEVSWTASASGDAERLDELEDRLGNERLDEMARFPGRGDGISRRDVLARREALLAAIEAAEAAPALAQRRRGILADHPNRLRQRGAQRITPAIRIQPQLGQRLAQKVYLVDIANKNGFEMLTEAGHGGAPGHDVAHGVPVAQLLSQRLDLPACFLDWQFALSRSYDFRIALQAKNQIRFRRQLGEQTGDRGWQADAKAARIKRHIIGITVE